MDLVYARLDLITYELSLYVISKETKDDDMVDIVSLRFLAVINDRVHVSRFLVVRECMNAYEKSDGRMAEE